MKTDKELLKEAWKIIDNLLDAIDYDIEERKKGNHGAYNNLFKHYVAAEDWINDHEFE